MKLFLRLFAWSCFLGVLIAVGIGVFHFVRHQPRVTIVASAVKLLEHLSADGHWLVTRDLQDGGQNLRVWDLGTGTLARSIPVLIGPGIPSPDQTLLAFCQQEQPIQIVHWHTGETWKIPVPARTWDNSLQFSPRGKWLRVTARDRGPAECIIDLANRKVAWRSGAKFLGFTNDDRHVVCAGDKAALTVHEAAAGRQVAKVQSDTDPDWPAVCLQSPHGQWLVTLVASAHPQDGYIGDVNLNLKESATAEGRSAHVRTDYQIGDLRVRGFEVWEATTGRKMWRIERPESDGRAFCFSADSRRLATWYAYRSDRGGKYEAEFFDFETGKRVAVMPLKAHGAGCFSEDGELFLFRSDEDDTIAMFDVGQGRVLWERKCGEEIAGLNQDWFVRDAHQVLHASNDPRRLDVLNPETGEPVMILSKDFAWQNKVVGRKFIAFDGMLDHRQLLSDVPWLTHRWPALFGPRNHVLAVVDLDTGQEQIRLRRAKGFGFRISEDGQTLVTIEERAAAEEGDGSRDIHVWDVHPRRAYFWAVAWPFGIGGVILALRRWRSRRKAAISTTVAA